MNSRERFFRTMKFEKLDRPFLWPQWVYEDSKDRWYEEGMPQGVHFNTLFGFDRVEMIPKSRNTG